MENELKSIMYKIDKLNLLRHIYYQKITSITGLHMGQPPILDYVIKNHGCTQIEIADELQISAASVAISTKRMQKAGLLKKVADKNNLRRNKLTITKKGYTVLKKCKEEFDKFDSQLFQDFDNKALEQLSNFINIMINNIISEEFSNKTIESLIELENKLRVQNLKNMEETKYD